MSGNLPDAPSAKKPGLLPLSMVFAIPFIAVAAVNLKTGVALSAAMVVVMLPSSLLLFLLQEKLGLREVVSFPVSVLTAMLLASASTRILRAISPEMTDLLGSYLYMLAAYPVLTVSTAKRRLKSVSTLLLTDLLHLLAFALLALPISALRELLTSRQLWGKPLDLLPQLPAAKWTFFGLILMGMMLALVSLFSKGLSGGASRRRKKPRKEEKT